MQIDLKSFIRQGRDAADITPLLRDNEAFAELINRLSVKLLDLDFEKVVCIEARGFILGGAVSFKLGKGLVPVRYPGKLKNKTFSTKYIDYTGKEKVLEIHTDALAEGERVVIVDDWLQTGETMKAAIRLVEQIKGKVVGTVVFMDDSKQEIKEELSKYNYQFLEKDLKQKEDF